MSDFIISVIRTWVPIGVGALITWLATKGVELDDTVRANLIAGATGLVSAVYYALVRALEEKNSNFGWLLGIRKAPKY
jgi:uncharacterized membrane protein (DUF441 family)